MRYRLLFISPRFLFPADSGGKIRTSQILRGMKGGRFDITLVSPQPNGGAERFRVDLESVCDRFVGWPAAARGRLLKVSRMRHLLSRKPVPVATDRSSGGSRVVAAELDRRPDVVVFDFPHSAVLGPPSTGVPSVLFTHNVESLIFRRHADVARNPVKRVVWRNQLRKMERFEQDTLSRFATVVAVSEGDAAYFREKFGTENVSIIPTGVDLDFFNYAPPGDSETLVFTGSMDWLANVDGIRYLMQEIWPRVVASAPEASMRVVGANPPEQLVKIAAGLRWHFTGFVDDIRPHVHGCSAFVIPLRVGGGTRVKAFEAMAMGCPVVSTTIGVEGLPLEPGVHYLRADAPSEFASAVMCLLRDPGLRIRISRAAREHVEKNFSFRRAAGVFEEICLKTAAENRRQS